MDSNSPAPQPPVLPYSQLRAGTCPRCGSSVKKSVSFTWWGGLLGPKLLHHVKCGGCGCGYNSKTGKSNDTAIAVYVAATFVIVGICAALYFFA